MTNRSPISYIQLLFLCILCLVASCTNTSTQVAPANELVQKSILDHPHIEHFKATLHHIVAERATNKRNAPQHFYVSKYTEESSTTPILYMLWQEEKLIWIFNLGGNTEESWLGLRYPSNGQLISLEEGIVDTQEAVGSSTYLVSKAWAKEVVYQIVVNGDFITTDKFVNML